MKKRLAILCVMALTMSMLGACSSGTADTAATKNEAQGESEDSADPEEELTPAKDPAEGSITQLTLDVPVEINGKEFTVTTEQAYPDDEEILAVNATYGDQTLKLDESLGVNGIYEVVQEDGTYVMTETYTFDDYSIVYLVKVDENGMTQTDTRDGALGEMPESPSDGFAITSKVDVLGTYGGTRTYTITDGRFTSENNLYEFQGAPDGDRQTLTVKGTISCRIEGGNTELKAGDVITPTGYSAEDGTFYFELEDGTPGSFLVDLDGEGNYANTVGGVDENELFESLPYAG